MRARHILRKEMSIAKTQTSESFRLSALLSFSGGLQDAYTYNVNDEELDALSAEALDQINDKGYDTEMCEEGVTQIIKFGIAFSGKRVKIRTE